MTLRYKTSTSKLCSHQWSNTINVLWSMGNLKGNFPTVFSQNVGGRQITASKLDGSNSNLCKSWKRMSQKIHPKFINDLIVFKNTRSHYEGIAWRFSARTLLTGAVHSLKPCLRALSSQGQYGNAQGGPKVVTPTLRLIAATLLTYQI